MNKISANPFVVVNFYTIKDYIQICLISVFAGIRLVFFSLFMLLSAIFGHLLHFIKDIHNPKDYTAWKKYYIFLPIFMIRCALYALGFFKVNLIDKSLETKSNTAVIQLLVPHSSIVDYFAVCFLGLPAFVARSQTKEVWIISKLVSLGNAITVDRNDKHSRKKTVELIKERAEKERVILFPEGTNGNREMMIKFKLGAFIPALPVQPVFIKYSHTDIDSYSWAWEGPSATLGFFLTCCKLYSTLSLVKLPIYYPNEEEKKNPALFAHNVQKYIEKECNLKLSHYVYDDAQYLQFADSVKLPRSPIGIKLLKICHQIYQLKNRNSSLINNKSSLQHMNKDEMESILDELIKSFFKNYNCMEGREIRTVKDILLAFNLYEKYSSLEGSSVMQEFLSTLHGFSKRNVLITNKHLAMVLILCNISKENIWQRLNDLLIYFNDMKTDLKQNGQASITKPYLTISEYKYLIWCLIGLESNLINLDFSLQSSPITYDFLTQNFTKTFTRAVKENAKYLLKDKY